MFTVEGPQSQLKNNPSLNLAQLRQILAPVIELGRSRISMICHVLRRFERAAVTEKHRHARAPKRAVAERLRQPRAAMHRAFTTRSMSRLLMASPVNLCALSSEARSRACLFHLNDAQPLWL